MIKLLKLLRYALFYFWSVSPILSLTNDSTFGTISYIKKFNICVTDPRISLINLM